MAAPDEDAPTTPASAAHARLLSFVAHELRSPVTVAVGTLSMLESGRYDPLPPAQLHVVAMALRAVAGVKAIADDMGLVARVTRGEWPLLRSAVAIHDIIADIAHVLHGSNPELALDIPSDAPRATVVVDRTSLARAGAALGQFAMREAPGDAVAFRAADTPDHHWLIVSAPGVVPGALDAGAPDLDPSTSGNGFALHAAASLLALHGLRARVLVAEPGRVAVGVAFPR
jgi:K+-sensing histidine kinase KdpD